MGGGLEEGGVLLWCRGIGPRRLARWGADGVGGRMGGKLGKSKPGLLPSLLLPSMAD